MQEDSWFMIFILHPIWAVVGRSALVALILSSWFPLSAQQVPDSTYEHYLALSWLRAVESDFWTSGEIVDYGAVREPASAEMQRLLQKLDRADYVSYAPANPSAPSPCWALRAVRHANDPGMYTVVGRAGTIVVQHSAMASGISALKRSVVIVCMPKPPRQLFVMLKGIR